MRQAKTNVVSWSDVRRRREKGKLGERRTNVDLEKRTHFPQYLVEFRRLHLSNRVKNDAVFNCEKSLRTNEACLGELSALKIATIQRNRESIGSRAARDLTENQIPTWKIGNY